MSAETSRTEISASIVEQASAWFIEFNEGELDIDKRVQFNHWIRRSPEHVRAYLEIAAAWEEATSLGQRQRLEPQRLIAQTLAQSNVVPLAAASLYMPTNTNFVAPAQVRREASPQDATLATKNTSHTGIVRVRARWLAIAASVLIVAVSLFTAFVRYWGTYSTDIGEQRSIMLADGSTVELNSLSKLRIDFSRTERTVELLQGQALFRVAKDARRPFTVRAGETDARAVGTQFDVYRKKSGTTVTVLEGQVNVEALLLSAGDQITVTSRSTLSPVRANVSNVIAWTQRKLVFEEVPLADAAEEFNRYNVRRLVIDDAVLESFHVRGTFSANNPERLVHFLEQRFDITVIETTGEIRISRRPHSPSQKNNF